MSAGFADPYTEGSAWGFSDPYEAAGAEAGFGDPYDLTRAELSGGRAVVPHTGGAPLDLVGFFPSPPYMIRLTIEGTQRELYSGRPAQGPLLYPSRGRLRAYTLPSPAGEYELTLLHGAGFQQSTPLSQRLEVAPAARLHERYTLAQSWPALYATGPRESAAQDIDTATRTPTRGALEVLLETGASVTTRTARPASITTTATTAGESVELTLESLLGFPERGALWIGTHPHAFPFERTSNGVRLLTRAPLIPRLTPVEVSRVY